ncbi:hypothetical protein [Neoactinobaculum massilliense]|uniref:hypothetical protein n=1 Tax=Neoactinobaculum massilliense TaxID=2364794 RepID=UPI0019D04B7D|nr:hypothetical protein [Neoactinobaculum massilliense]
MSTVDKDALNFEYERKFFVEHLPEDVVRSASIQAIVQAYLFAEDGYAVRVRIAFPDREYAMVPFSEDVDFLGSYERRALASLMSDDDVRSSTGMGTDDVRSGARVGDDVLRFGAGMGSGAVRLMPGMTGDAGRSGAVRPGAEIDTDDVWSGAGASDDSGRFSAGMTGGAGRFRAGAGSRADGGMGDARPRATVAVKSPAVAGERYELEVELDVDVARQIIRRSSNVVLKNRYSLWIDEDGWEFDVFGGQNAGLVIAEIERLGPVVDLKIPDFAVSEVTEDTRFTNDFLSKEPWLSWADNYRTELAVQGPHFLDLHGPE